MWDFVYKQMVSIYSIYKSFIGYSHFKVKRLVEFYAIIISWDCIQFYLYTISLSDTSRVCMDYNIIFIIIIIIEGLTCGTPFITYNNALF